MGNSQHLNMVVKGKGLVHSSQEQSGISNEPNCHVVQCAPIKCISICLWFPFKFGFPLEMFVFMTS